MTLLERNSRNVQLTAAGKVLLREGRRTLTQARRAVKATQTASARRLAIGFYGSAAAPQLPEILRRFDALRPSVQVTVRELLLGTIEEILDGTVELAFTRMIPGQAELNIQLLAHEPRLAVLPSNHRLSGQDRLTFADLRKESFIINPVIKDEDVPSRWLTEQRRHGLRGRIATAATSIQEILTLVAAGKGICLLPASVEHRYPRSDVVYRPVLDAEPAALSLARRRGRVSPAADAFIEIARDVIGQTERSARDG